jgi:hypothetical protein
LALAARKEMEQYSFRSTMFDWHLAVRRCSFILLEFLRAWSANPSCSTFWQSV